MPSSFRSEIHSSHAVNPSTQIAKKIFLTLGERLMGMLPLGVLLDGLGNALQGRGDGRQFINDGGRLGRVAAAGHRAASCSSQPSASKSASPIAASQAGLSGVGSKRGSADR